MASKKLLEMLNRAIAMELQVSIQYMWQNVLWKGIEGYSVKNVFREAAIDEMKHAEMIAERLVYLGGMPTITPSPIIIGDTIEAMIKQDKKDEEEAIKFYKEIVAEAEKERDIVTGELFKKILADEEEHHDIFSSLLEKNK